MPRLIDGSEVASWSESWRHETEARMVSERPTLEDRRAYLDVVERRRGKPAADALRATMRVIWELKA